jgi:hypothetical protein
MRDSYDKDPTTTSMYDDGHVYTDHAGSLKWKFAGGPATEYQASTGVSPFKLVQHHHKHHNDRRDTFDSDPTSTSMYDDGHIYTDKPGSLKNPAPAVEKTEEKAPESKTLLHKKHHHHKHGRDTFDSDPTSTSMYDDGHIYTDKPGSFKNPAPVEEKKEEKAPESKSLMHKKHHHHKHGGRRDTYDHDPDTASMYDDQHAYSKPGAFVPSPGAAVNTKGKLPETDTSPIPVPALSQHTLRSRDSYDKDPTTTSMYDDGHVYTDHAGSLKWKFAGGPAAEYQASTGVSPFKLVQ